MKLPVTICVTGGIACGKSLVGGFLADLGVAVRDADDVCHELMVSGGDLYGRIVSAFGGEIVGADGEIDRRILGRLVCSHPKKRDELNRLVHPDVNRELDAWIAGCADRWLCCPAGEGADGPARRPVRRSFGEDGSPERSRGGAGGRWTHGVAVIIPLVYEVGWEHSWDRVICVGAPVVLQVERLKRRGLSEREAMAWINAQLQVEEKMRRADYVVFNAGTRENARVQTVKVFQDITQQVEKQHGRGEQNGRR